MDHLNKMGKKIEKIAQEAPDTSLAKPAPQEAG
jgi:hypothetical protein